MNAGFATVGDVLAAGEHRLLAVPGLGPASVAVIMQAAGAARASVAGQTVVRLDASRPTSAHTVLLRGLRERLGAGRIVAAAAEPQQRLLRMLPSAISAAGPGTMVRRRLFRGPAVKAGDQEALQRLAVLLSGPEIAAVDVAFADLRAAGLEARQASPIRYGVISRRRRPSTRRCWPRPPARVESVRRRPGTCRSGWSAPPSRSLWTAAC